jgi:serine/threonine protein kinase
LYRREAEAMANLPAGLPVPRLIDVYDDGGWVALVFDDVRGRHPQAPWRRTELDRVVATLDELAAALQPSPWRDAPGFAEDNPELMNQWCELAETAPPDLEPWVHQQLGRMVAANVDIGGLIRGDVLLHTDLRADNILLTPDGHAVLLDWAWACKGAPWLDLLLFAVAVNAEGGADAEVLIRNHPRTHDLASSSIDAILLAVGTAYWSASRLSEPPSLPGIRAFQRGWADATLSWVRRRLVQRGAL